MNDDEFKDFAKQEQPKMKVNSCTRKEIHAAYTIKAFLAQWAAITSLLTTSACLAKGAYRSYKKESPEKKE